MIIDAQSDTITTTNLLPTNVTIGSSLFLPTSGGTPANFDYYEEYTSSGNEFSGIWADPIALEYKIKRMGKIVSLIIPDGLYATANTASFITASQNIPSRFRQAYSIYYPLIVKDNGTVKTTLLQINSAGLFRIWGTLNSGNFAGSGDSGALPQSVPIGLIL